MYLTLRILHIVTGVFWAGTIFFTVSYLMPTLRELGPDGGKVFATLRRRRMFTAVPVVALISVVTGLWMYGLRAGGGSGWARTPEAMSLGLGAVAGVLALLIGLLGMRANSLKADDLSKEAAQMPAGAERDAKMALIQKMRVRATMSARAVATLLLITVVTMAVARYL